MKTVAEVIGVSRSNLTERLQERPQSRIGRPPLPDGELVAQIKVLIGELPTYGYRRVHAILKRQALAAGLRPANHKRIYRVMKAHGLLLDRHAGGVERRHDGRVAVDERKLYEVRWAARRCYRRSARPHGISLSVCRKFEVAAQISRESR